MLSGCGRHRLLVALVTGAILSLAAPALGQSGRIMGKVTDEHGQPVAGASVEVSVASEGGARWNVKTSENGDYIIPRVPGGRYIVIVSKAGVGTARTQGDLRVSGFAAVDVTLRRPTVAAEGHCADRPASRTLDEKVVAAFAVHPDLARLLQWLVAAEHHIPGCADLAATTMAGWSRQDLDNVLADVAVLSTFLQRVRELEKRDPVAWQESRANAAASRAGRHERGDDPRVTIRLHERSLTIFDVEQVFHGNDTIRRGAVLHADIGALIGDDLSRQPLFFADGRQHGRVRGTVHFEIGRRLLDSVAPSPSADAGALLWYRAISAQLLREGRLNEAPAHLDKAREVFPGRSSFLVDSGYLHQKRASPAVQAAVQEMRDRGIHIGVDRHRTELERAERFFRQALELTPDDSDVRLRLGHTLGELGRHDEAAVELRRARDGERDRQRLYLVELFLGREEQRSGRPDEARRHFENAAALYSNAQSPRLALSLLARQAGDRKGALLALEQVNAPLASRADADDPFWFYHQHHLSDADALMAQMRKIGAGK
jgi:tetratricopeptide (TPR) repeat protein